MITLSEQITVAHPIETVFRYVSDFCTIEQWDPGVRSALKTTPGRAGVGTRYRLQLVYAMMPVTMTYTIVAFQAPSKVVLRGHGGAFTATDTITFTPIGRKTRVQYRADIQFQGIGRVIAPLFRRALDRIGKRAMAGLSSAFNRKIRAPRMGRGTTLLDRSIVGGLPAFTRQGYQAARRRWQPVTESLDNKTVVITGATSGIGQAAAQSLAHRGARVVIVARNREKAEAVRHQIAVSTGNDNIGIYTADMGLRHQVKQAAKAMAAHEARIDILINNAGALFPTRRLTAEGLERTFATDLLGPFALTESLIAKLSSSGPSRIINVSSGGMYTQGIFPDDLEYAGEPYDGSKAYARAKRGLVILTELWAARFQRAGIAVHAMHPGWVRTPGVKASLPGFYRWTARVLRTPEQGADTIVWLAAAPEAARVTGLFWLDRTPRITHVLSSTRELPRQRKQLYDTLTKMMEKEGA